MDDTPTPELYSWKFVAPARRGEQQARQWDEYLDYRCRWSFADGRDAGIEWLWDQPIPDRLDWWNEVDRLNIRLAAMERAEKSAAPTLTDDPE